jgi:putative peptidoglycan lipid II flippase
VVALLNAWLLFMLPHSIITVSLATAFYPRMSEHAAEGDTAAVRDDLSTVLRLVLITMGAATVVLVAAAIPVTAIFSGTTPHLTIAQQTYAVAPVLVAYVLGLLPFTVLYVVQRGFYALADTRTPFRFTITQLLVVVPGILLCLLLPLPVRAAGVALVISIGGTLQLVVATRLLRRRLGPLLDAHLAGAVRRVVVAGVPALLAGVAVLALLGGFSSGWPVQSRLGGFGATILVSAVCGLVYLAVLALLKAPELRLVTDVVRSRIRR